MKKIKLYQNIAKILGIKKLKTIPLPSSNQAVSYYQIQKELAWPRRQKKNRTKDNTLEKLQSCNFYQKIAKIGDIKMLKSFLLQQKLCSTLLSNSTGDFFTLEKGKTSKKNMKKGFKEFAKTC